MREVNMSVVTLRSAMAFAAVMYFLTPLQSTLAEALINSACSKLKMIGDDSKRLKAQWESIAIDNKAERCPLYKQQIKYNDEMINIFESDSNRCGVRKAVLEQLKTSTDKLRVTMSTLCS
jgi:hypothetical protein